MSTDQSQNKDSRILYEKNSKLVVEIKMHQTGTVYRRLYFKEYPDQIQSEVIHISKTQKQINLDDFSVYKEIMNNLAFIREEKQKVNPKQYSALILGAGGSVLGDSMRDFGVDKVIEIDIDPEVFEIGDKFFRTVHIF